MFVVLSVCYVVLDVGWCYLILDDVLMLIRWMLCFVGGVLLWWWCIPVGFVRVFLCVVLFFRWCGVVLVLVWGGLWRSSHLVVVGFFRCHFLVAALL